jgi:hypothetical protein
MSKNPCALLGAVFLVEEIQVCYHLTQKFPGGDFADFPALMN